ncbi:MAG: DUF2183 domain-containing protein [Balneolaceae bacterium]|nr:MAG: DUF2183 domain-containing protein [Balneolaceae bacterium]
MRYILLFVILFTADGYIPQLNTEESQDRPRREIILYKTYGYLDGDEWVIPARVLVQKKRRWLQGLITWTMDLTSDYSDDQIDIFRYRLRNIVANSKGRRTVTIRIQGQDQEQRFQIKDSHGDFPRTDRNGLIRGEIRIPVDLASELLRYQQSENGWLTLELRSGRYRGSGHVQLIEPEGLSVISDIDDTVKVTEIPAGARVVVRNTFFREYSAAPGIAEMYDQWNDAAFHYVSGSPWQLFLSLSSFLFGDQAGFPKGSFHMKSARKNPMTISTWRDLLAFVTNENLTFEQKIDQISVIFQHFPDRQFILVGDSGERDPEVYSEILTRYPGQVKKIYIRDVINDRELNPERLAGMTIIPAPTILRQGVSVEELSEDIADADF